MTKVGCLTYCTSRGLSHLAKAFHAHGLIHEVCLVMHPSVPNHPEWYPDAPQVNLRGMDINRVREWARSLDVLLAFETFFDPSLVPWCREHKIRTILIPMYECFQEQWSTPDKFICPSLLDMDYFDPKDGIWAKRHSSNAPAVFLPLPVEYPWRLRKQAETYLHCGGYLGIRGREGTELLIEAMHYVESPLRLIIRCQENVSSAAQRMAAADRRIDYRAGTVPYEELYAEGDVAVGAQRWNGCSLPLQEARASGMLVMNTDRYPMSTWLPREPLIPVQAYRKARIGGAYLEFEEAIVTPEAIAAKMDQWYGQPIEAFSRSGREWAEANSWAALKGRWLEELAS